MSDMKEKLIEAASKFNESYEPRAHAVHMDSLPVIKIMANQKCQFRKVIKLRGQHSGKWKPEFGFIAIPGGAVLRSSNDEKHIDGDFVRCPYGMPGDELWVKEDFFEVPKDESPGVLQKFSRWLCRALGAEDEIFPRYLYRSDYALPGTGTAYYRGKPIEWTPRMFMPRDAVRTTLVVTRVQVERLHESLRKQPAGARSSGMDGITAEGYSSSLDFRGAWNSIYADRGWGWEDNPWVWVVDFDVVSKDNE